MHANERKAVAQRAISLVDLTDLNDGSNHEAIDDLCKRAQTAFGNVGAICIWPRFVSHAKKQLRGTNIPIATVVNFPGGNQGVDMTTAETLSAVDDGADEIDLVLPYQALVAGDESAARTMLVAIRSATRGKALLKVILETGELGDEALIRRASRLAIAAGADFIKTSTGKVAENATLPTAKIMLEEIAVSKKTVGFKPAGGIKTTEDCGDYLALADEIMGSDWATSKTFRFGASSVLDDLLAAIQGEEAEVSKGY